MAEIGIVKNLNASHGSKVHQHCFKIEFVFDGKLDGDFVGGIDFHEVMPKIDSILSSLENKYLPEVSGIGRGTCENLAVYLFKNLNMQNLKSIMIWEDIDRYAKIFREDLR